MFELEMLDFVVFGGGRMVEKSLAMDAVADLRQVTKQTI